MPDSRFFEDLGPLSLADLAAACGAQWREPEAAPVFIAHVAPLDRAERADVSFLADRRYLADLKSTRAAAVFLTAGYADAAPSSWARLITDEPLSAYARAAALLHRPRLHPADSPAHHPQAEVEDGVALGPGVVLGPGARIGAGTTIGANTVIGPGVALGRHCCIGSNATIGFALIGDHVKILAGATIGEAGFGVAGGRAGATDVPQLGRVIIQDGVTIGANSCLDRGAWGDTVVGENTKIDNLVQVAHNVRIGRNCVLAAHTGISGSVTVGDNAMFGGRAGVADHLDIGAGSKIAAAAGVMKDIPPGEIWAGSPARPLRRFMRETAWLARQVKDREGE